MENFILISTVKLDNLIPIHKYVSTKTSLTVYVANEINSPFVETNICVGYDMHDDSELASIIHYIAPYGIPKFPHKDFNGYISSKVLCDDYDIWSYGDNVKLTIRSLGYKSSLAMLPIAMEQVFRPSWPDEAFMKEVHRVNCKGEDCGTLYERLKSKECTVSGRASKELAAALYPPYNKEHFETKLRDPALKDKVKEFHMKYFIPRNACIIVTGQVATEALFETLNTIENDIFVNLPQRNQLHNKQHQESFSEIEQRIQRISVPAENEEVGSVIFGWRGHILSHENGVKDLLACRVIKTYLYSDDTSVFQKEVFSLKETPTTSVYWTENTYKIPSFELCMTSLPTNELEIYVPAIKDVLSRIHNSEINIDMNQIKDLIHEKRQISARAFDSYLDGTVTELCNFAFSYLEDNEEYYKQALNPLDTWKQLENEPEDYWLNLIKTVFTDDFFAVIATPSKKLYEQTLEEEKKCAAARVADMEFKNQTALDEQLEIAHEDKVPDEFFANISVTLENENITPIKVKTWTTNGDEECPHFNLKKIPFYTWIDSIQTNFAYIAIIMDTNQMDINMKKWIALLLSCLSIKPNGKDETLDEFTRKVAELHRTCPQADTSIGILPVGTFDAAWFINYAAVSVMVEPNDYETVVDLLWDLLYGCELTVDILRRITKHVEEFANEIKDIDSYMAIDLLNVQLFKHDTNVYVSKILSQVAFLDELNTRLKGDEQMVNEVVKEANAARKSMLEHVFVHLTCNFDSYHLSDEPWRKFGNTNTSIQTPEIIHDSELTSHAGGGCYILALNDESDVIIEQSSPGPCRINHPDYLPLSVAIQYINHILRDRHEEDNNYWLHIRLEIDEGAIKIFILRDTYKTVYSEAKDLLDILIDGKEINMQIFDNAKNKVALALMQFESEVGTIVSELRRSHFQNVDINFNRTLLKNLGKLTVEEVQEAAKLWLPNLFDPKLTTLGAVCSPKDISDVQAVLTELNYNVNVLSSPEDMLDIPEL